MGLACSRTATQARFETHILPVATHTYDALTDAPAMLWRLELAAPRSVSELGGSHAQNQLFRDIADLSWTRAQTMTRTAE